MKTRDTPSLLDIVDGMIDFSDEMVTKTAQLIDLVVETISKRGTGVDDRLDRALLWRRDNQRVAPINSTVVRAMLAKRLPV
jgi:hypothetical protein